MMNTYTTKPLNALHRIHIFKTLNRLVPKSTYSFKTLNEMKSYVLLQNIKCVGIVCLNACINQHTLSKH